MCYYFYLILLHFLYLFLTAIVKCNWFVEAIAENQPLTVTLIGQVYIIIFIVNYKRNINSLSIFYTCLPLCEKLFGLAFRWYPRLPPLWFSAGDFSRRRKSPVLRPIFRISLLRLTIFWIPSSPRSSTFGDSI